MKQTVQITLASIVAITLMTTGIVYANDDDDTKDKLIAKLQNQLAGTIDSYNKAINSSNYFMAQAQHLNIELEGWKKIADNNRMQYVEVFNDRQILRMNTDATISDLNDQISELNKKLQSAQNNTVDTTALNEKITKLQDDKKSLIEKRDELKDDKQNLKQTIKELKAENSKLKDDKKELKQENKKQQKQIDKLKGLRDDVNTDTITGLNSKNPIPEPEYTPIPEPENAPVTLNKTTIKQGDNLEFIVNWESVYYYNPQELTFSGDDKNQTYHRNHSIGIVSAMIDIHGVGGASIQYIPIMGGPWNNDVYEVRTNTLHNPNFWPASYAEHENTDFLIPAVNLKIINQTAFSFEIPTPNNHAIGLHNATIITVFAQDMDKKGTERYSVIIGNGVYVDSRFTPNSYFVQYEVTP